MEQGAVDGELQSQVQVHGGQVKRQPAGVKCRQKPDEGTRHILQRHSGKTSHYYWIWMLLSLQTAAIILSSESPEDKRQRVPHLFGSQNHVYFLLVYNVSKLSFAVVMLDD